MPSIALLLLFFAVVVLFCTLLNNASQKVGMPVLLAFILLGMLMGNNGLFPIRFENYDFAEEICSVALIFIMFYGGFGVRWQSARAVVVEAGLLASLGVVVTAGILGLFCHFVLHWGWIESFLMGSVVGSTDAASVFSILRSRKLGLKNNTAPLLEIESGSNDPFSNMLTMIMLLLLKGGATTGAVLWTLFAQIVFGVGLGILLAKLSEYCIKHISFATEGFNSLFLLATAALAFALPELIGGNGYISVYIVGIKLGNTDFQGKRELVNFFDGLTSLMQVIIFFLLGLLSRPSMMTKVLLPALAIFLAMFLLARPAAIALILTPFRKYGLRQQALISFVGLRGAASIVFAIMVTLGDTPLENDILNIVFCIVLLSIAIQGTLIPFASKKLKMIDENLDVMKTFTDFNDETDMQFSEVKVRADSPWIGHNIKELGIPKNLLFCMIIRPDGTKIVPNGYTVIEKDDTVIICSKAFRDSQSLKIVEHRLTANSRWLGKSVKEYPVKKNQVIIVRRGEESIIPHGDTILQENDLLFINKSL